MATLWKVFNGAFPTTAAPVSVTTGATVKTMLQLKPAVDIKIVAWGVSMDQSAVATPGKWEACCTGTVFGTVTAYAAGDVMPFYDPNALANTTGTSGVPLNLGTTHSGYTCTSEGAITAYRLADIQYIDPVNQYEKEWSLGREFGVKAGECFRIRCTLGSAVNAYCWVLFEA